MVDRGTRSWNEQDAEARVELFHPDMVWPWPPDPLAHDPVGWILTQGRYDRERWRRGWQHLFDTHELLHNNRSIVMIAVSAEGNGGVAGGHVDTPRRPSTGHDFRWEGPGGKHYTLLHGGGEKVL